MFCSPIFTIFTKSSTHSSTVISSHPIDHINISLYILTMQSFPSALSPKFIPADLSLPSPGHSFILFCLVRFVFFLPSASYPVAIHQGLKQPTGSPKSFSSNVCVCWRRWGYHCLVTLWFSPALTPSLNPLRSWPLLTAPEYAHMRFGANGCFATLEHPST